MNTLEDSAKEAFCVQIKNLPISMQSSILCHCIEEVPKILAAMISHGNESSLDKDWQLTFKESKASILIAKYLYDKIWIHLPLQCWPTLRPTAPPF